MATDVRDLEMVDMLPIGPAGMFDPDIMKRDVALLQKRLKSMNRWLINPRSRYAQYWDFVVLFAMLFTSSVTPYEVCLLWSDPEFDALFYIK